MKSQENNKSVLCNKNKRYNYKLWLNNCFEGPGGLEKMQETSGTNPAPIACQKFPDSCMVPSYDQNIVVLDFLNSFPLMWASGRRVWLFDSKVDYT